MGNFKVQQVANTAWAFATVGHLGIPLLAAIVSARSGLGATLRRRTSPAQLGHL